MWPYAWLGECYCYFSRPLFVDKCELRTESACVPFPACKQNEEEGPNEEGQTEQEPQSFLFPKRTTTDYIDAGTLNKKLEALTACLWAKPRGPLSDTYDSFINYAVSQGKHTLIMGRVKKSFRAVVAGGYVG